MTDEELENRISQLEEKVYGQQDNSKLKKKIGELQTKLRDQKEEGKELETRLNEQKRILQTVKEEEEILEEVESLKRDVQNLSESSKEELEELSDKNIDRLDDYLEQAGKLEDNIEKAIDSHEQMLDRFDDQISEVHQEIAVAMEKADMTLSLQAFSLIETYVPGEYREKLSRTVGECHRLPYERTATLTGLVAAWVALCEGELDEHYEEDPKRDVELFEAFLVDRRLNYETDGVWNNIGKYMEDDEEVDEFIESGKGKKIQENIWKVLGEPNTELLDFDCDSHVLRIHRGITDEKRQEAVEWFENHYQLQDRREAVKSLTERYFGDGKE